MENKKAFHGVKMSNENKCGAEDSKGEKARR